MSVLRSWWVVSRDIKRLMSFLLRLRVDMRFLGLSVVLLVVFAFVQTYSVAILYALINGIIRGNFEAVREMKVVGRLFQPVPPALLFVALIAWNYVITVVRCAVEYSAELSMAYQAQRAAVAMRRVVFERYLAFGKLFFDRNNVASLTQVLMSSTNAISTQLTNFQQLLAQLTTLAVYLCLMLVTSWRLTLAVGAIFPLMSFCTSQFTQRVRQRSLDHQQSLTSLNQKIYNVLTCIPLVKGYAREDAEQRFFEQVSDQEVAAAFAQAKAQHLYNPIYDISQTTALLLTACALSYIGAHQHLEAGQILVFFFMAHRSVPLFNAFNTFATSTAALEGSLTAIEGVLSDDDKFLVPEGGRVFEGLTRRLEFRDLHFGYEALRPVLKGVDFTLEAGKMLAIVGATGAGKSTLVHLLLRYYDCPPGSLLLDGIDIREFSQRSLRERMAFVSQDAFIFHDTVRNNIAYALSEKTVPDDVMAAVLHKARLYDFVQSLPEGLDTVVGDNGVKLSGGEKQRVALARALLKDAEILILDEATSSMDSLTESLIQEALEKTVQGRTTLVIAHRLSTIRRADKIIVLENGVVAESGPIDELMARRGLFFALWEAQALGRI